MGPAEYVIECFWPGVRESDLRALDERVHTHTAEEPVCYLGSLLIREDEVVLCMFEGEAEAVRRVAEHAEIPFERILAAAQSPWPLADSPNQRSST
jgi:Nickel responsive protein SCO4226-like